MWLREASIHSKLNGTKRPTIIQLLGIDSRVHSLYLEHIEAPSLAQRAWRNASDHFSGTPADANRILNDISSALDFVHQNDICHNDIKPANILFSAKRGAVLIDFGLGSDDSEIHQHLGGSPWYIPPEFLVNPRGGRGKPGDVYALGLVGFYLLCLIPFPDKGAGWKIWAVASQTDSEADTAVRSMREWIRNVQDVRTRLGHGLVEDILRRMTDVNRRKRIAIRDVVKALASGSDQQTV